MKENISIIRIFKPFAYLTLLGISVGGVLSISRILERWESTFYILLIGVIISLFPSVDTDRHKWRMTWYILIQTILVGILLQDPDTGSIFAVIFFLLSVAAGLYFSLRFSMVWITTFVLLVFFSHLRFNLLYSAIQNTLSLAGGFYFLGIVANTSTKLQIEQTRNRQLVEELLEKNKQLEEYANQAEYLAVIQERNHLAREVHDTIGHRLTVASIQLEGAQKLMVEQPERAKKMLETVQDQVHTALQDLRVTVKRLREPAEVDLPLSISLNELIDSFQKATGLEIHISLDLENVVLTSNQKIMVYRTIQEALTNIQRHASASNTWLELTRTKTSLILTIKDDGKGFSDTPENFGFGLKGILERAELLDTEVNIASAPGEGTQITMVLPIQTQGDL